jgi:hypothetical protein
MSSEPKGPSSSPVPLSREQVDWLLQTAPDESLANAYVDVRSNEPRNAQSRQQFEKSLEDKFRIQLSDAVERIWELPQVILKNANDEYVRLFVEARELFVMGYFYSCVAMCGIVGEKLVKDLLRSTVLLTTDGLADRPSEDAFDQLERVDASAIMRFLNKAQVLGDEAAKAANSLIELRNKYAHARGKEPQADALESIKKLHILVEGTVSVLKSYEIVEGKLVQRASSV